MATQCVWLHQPIDPFDHFGSPTTEKRTFLTLENPTEIPSPKEDITHWQKSDRIAVLSCCITNSPFTYNFCATNISFCCCCYLFLETFFTPTAKKTPKHFFPTQTFFLPLPSPKRVPDWKKKFPLPPNYQSLPTASWQEEGGENRRELLVWTQNCFFAIGFASLSRV